MTALLSLSGIRKTYGSGELAVEVLHGVDLTIQAGEFVAIIGSSGSGKSTLMNIIGCLDRASAGTYVFAGHDVATLDADGLAALRRDGIGFVFQQYNLLANASALENVEVPAIYAGLPKDQRRVRARTLLEQVGLGQRLDHRPSQLSGGQQQRVSLARALMNGGQVILADEPTGALDSRTGREVMDLLHGLNAQGHTIILVTHDADVAAQARRVVRLADGLVVADDRRDDEPADIQLERPFAVHGGDRWAGAVCDGDRWAEAGEAVKLALRSLRANLFRTVLTLLGIVIGVGSVIAMLAFGDGAKRDVMTRIQAMGTNLLLVRPGIPGVRGPGGITTLTTGDAEEIATLPNVRRAVPEIEGSATFRYDSIDHSASVTATNADYPLSRDWPLARGVFFDADDVDTFATVVVLGRTAADSLFGDNDPIGEYVMLNNTPFLVIGVLDRKGASAWGSDLDDVAFVPLTTGGLRLFGRRHLRSITVEVDDTATMEPTRLEIERVLEARHNMVDFNIRNMASVLETAVATQNTMTVLLGAVAAISLLVGGIGVMNIMLVTVAERTREIGIRMATGARQSDILMQFLIEAVVVCTIGGLLGVAGGMGAALVTGAFAIPVAITPLPIVLAFGCAFATGLVFGFMPARKAARLDPVVALTSE